MVCDASYDGIWKKKLRWQYFIEFKLTEYIGDLMCNSIIWVKISSHILLYTLIHTFKLHINCDLKSQFQVENCNFKS